MNTKIINEIKFSYNEDKVIVSFVPFEESIPYNIHCHFTNLEECQEYCNLMKQKYNLDLMPKVYYTLIGIPNFVNWKATKEANKTVFYDEEEILLALILLREQIGKDTYDGID